MILAPSITCNDASGNHRFETSTQKSRLRCSKSPLHQRQRTKRRLGAIHPNEQPRDLRLQTKSRQQPRQSQRRHLQLRRLRRTL